MKHCRSIAVSGSLATNRSNEQLKRYLRSIRSGKKSGRICFNSASTSSQLYLNPQTEHLLDWFHVSMRQTVMNQMAKGLGSEESESRACALKQLESIK
jgi:hypothetical protein